MTCMSASTKASKFGLQVSFQSLWIVHCPSHCHLSRGQEMLWVRDCIFLTKEWGLGMRKYRSKFAHGGISYFRFRLLRECLSSSFSDLNETL